jgi:hypothetical protein
MLESIKKGIFEYFCQKTEEQREKTDQDYIQEVVNKVDELKDTQINAEMFLTLKFLRGYRLHITKSNPEAQPLSYVVFVFNQINAEVLEFLVKAGKNDNLKGILGFTNNAVMVKDYRY